MVELSLLQKGHGKEALYFSMEGVEENNIVFGQEGSFSETVIEVRRISKKTKGGNRIRFSALVVVGDKKGKVGAGLAKALDVRSAVRKAVEQAKRKMIRVPLSGTTIPFSVIKKHSAARVMLKPAPSGSGIIAGGTMRVVLDAAGIKDAVGKILGSRSKISNVYATILALQEIARLKEKKGGKARAKNE